MFLHLLYPYVKFIVGTLYPSYKTWKSLKRKDETKRRLWMKYWVSFGAFQTLEIFADITLAFILPFYTEIKLFIVLWLVMGTKILFDTIVNKELTRREKTIDMWLKRIARCRNEILAILWIEMSSFSLKILSALMSSGLSALLMNSNGEVSLNEPDDDDYGGDYDNNNGKPLDAIEQGSQKPRIGRRSTRLSSSAANGGRLSSVVKKESSGDIDDELLAEDEDEQDIPQKQQHQQQQQQVCTSESTSIREMEGLTEC